MLCEKCGTQFNSEDKFCTGCGSVVGQSEQHYQQPQYQYSNSQQQYQYYPPYPYQQPAVRKKKFPIFAIIIPVIVVAIVITLFVVLNLVSNHVSNQFDLITDTSPTPAEVFLAVHNAAMEGDVDAYINSSSLTEEQIETALRIGMFDTRADALDFIETILTNYRNKFYESYEVFTSDVIYTRVARVTVFTGANARNSIYSVRQFTLSGDELLDNKINEFFDNATHVAEVSIEIYSPYCNNLVEMIFVYFFVDETWQTIVRAFEWP